MLQAARGLRLTVEALQQIWIVGQSGGNGLQGDQPVDEGIAGAIDNSHAAAAQFTDEFVFAEFRQFMSYRLENKSGQNVSGLPLKPVCLVNPRLRIRESGAIQACPKPSGRSRPG